MPILFPAKPGALRIVGDHLSGVSLLIFPGWLIVLQIKHFAGRARLSFTKPR
jgi:hypothetical protein